MTMPGVQKPHWRPWCSWKAACIGCIVVPSASPSMVVTSQPSACTASIVQLFTDSPSTSTVHAPQLDVSQPTLVPVRPTSSRRWCTRSRLGSTSLVWTDPLTVTEICIVRTPRWRRTRGDLSYY